jgi:2,4-dienoyl-CoA reductase-like NADH-dependent reductase (Old Yellow Enzyme family)
LIDFLGIRRRPDKTRYLEHFLPITAEMRSRIGMEDVAEEALRKHLVALDDAELRAILNPREWEDLSHGHRERVTDVHREHIRELPKVLPGLFAASASRAELAGFDGVELHYAHAYTMASFLSATNTREDGYGGSLENRLRLPLEVYRAVREVLGPGTALGCRFLSEECIEGGTELAESSAIGVALAAAGMDFLSLSRGGKFDDAKQPRVGDAAYPYTGQSGFECMPGYIADEFGPFGRNVAPSATIRRAVRDNGLATPVVVAGGIHVFSQAEKLVAEDQADIVGLARQALADPDWFTKVRCGKGGDVRLCEYTNYCEGLDQKHKQVTCNLWDRIDLEEAGTSLSRDGRRRLVAPDWKPDSP